MKILLVGASGLVGQQVLRQALTERAVSRQIAPTRKPLPAAAQLDNPLADLLAAALAQAPGVHVVESERIALFRRVLAVLSAGQINDVPCIADLVEKPEAGVRSRARTHRFARPRA